MGLIKLAGLWYCWFCNELIIYMLQECCEGEKKRVREKQTPR